MYVKKRNFPETPDSATEQIDIAQVENTKLRRQMDTEAERSKKLGEQLADLEAENEKIRKAVLLRQVENMKLQEKYRQRSADYLQSLIDADRQMAETHAMRAHDPASDTMRFWQWVLRPQLEQEVVMRYASWKQVSKALQWHNKLNKDDVKMPERWMPQAPDALWIQFEDLPHPGDFD